MHVQLFKQFHWWNLKTKKQTNTTVHPHFREPGWSQRAPSIWRDKGMPLVELCMCTFSSNFIGGTNPVHTALVRTGLDWPPPQALFALLFRQYIGYSLSVHYIWTWLVEFLNDYIIKQWISNKIIFFHLLFLSKPFIIIVKDCKVAIINNVVN